MITSWTVIEFLDIIDRFFYLFLFVILLKKAGSWTNEEIDRESEKRSKKEDDKNRKSLYENIGRTVGDIFDDPDDKCSPDDEKIPKYELYTKIYTHIRRSR